MKEQLKPIFDAAADEVEALSRKRVEFLRQGQDALTTLPTFQEQRRAITRSSMEQARQLLSGLSNTDLINFAALYFAEYHRADRDAEKYKEHFLSMGRERISLLNRISKRQEVVNKRQEIFNAHLKQKRRNGAIARHAETREIKADVFAWLDSLPSEFERIEAAARAITKQQPITQGTARKYFKEWKNLRSASKP